MNRLVLDIATCLHWFFSDPNKRGEARSARQILSYVRDEQIGLVQPAVWATTLVGELVAFGLRDSATAAEEVVGMQVKVDNGPATLRHAVELANQLNRPVLQTIYHATALQNDICLITADEAYFRRANHLGNILRLRDWRSNPRIAEPATRYAVHLIPLAVETAARQFEQRAIACPILSSSNARMRQSSALS
ncbi:MAG TPA: hypothetical protein VHW73_15085 [Rudaea sp.]|jgi:predicted nucleic acid-binding protein|nr:hypothetical protein [Rudaea sp.]